MQTFAPPLNLKIWFVADCGLPKNIFSQRSYFEKKNTLIEGLRLEHNDIETAVFTIDFLHVVIYMQCKMVFLASWLFGFKTQINIPQVLFHSF